MLEANVGLAAHCAILHVESLNQKTTYQSLGEESSVELEDIICDDRPGPEDQLYCKELRAFIRDIFDNLPKLQRKVMLFHFKNGMNQSEIAYKLGISRSAVSQAMSQGIKKLKVTVKENGFIAPM